MQGQMDMARAHKEELAAVNEDQRQRELTARAQMVRDGSLVWMRLFLQEREADLAFAEFEELDFEAELEAAKLELAP